MSTNNSTLFVVNKSTTRNWKVVVIKQGEHYGLNNKLVHEKENPLVEFYDMKHNQFVSRYYLSTLLDIPDGQGLLLDGGNPAIWSLDGETMDSVKQWLSKSKV